MHHLKKGDEDCVFICFKVLKPQEKNCGGGYQGTGATGMKAATEKARDRANEDRSNNKGGRRCLYVTLKFDPPVFSDHLSPSRTIRRAMAMATPQRSYSALLHSTIRSEKKTSFTTGLGH